MFILMKQHATQHNSVIPIFYEIAFIHNKFATANIFKGNVKLHGLRFLST